MFPLGDKRELRRGIAAAEAAVGRRAPQRDRGRHTHARQVAYSQYWYAGQAQAVTEQLRALMTDLEQVARRAMAAASRRSRTRSRRRPS